MSDKKITMSRRKMLAGFGTIGVASVGAGVGTYAAFSDSKQAKATFTAGEIDGNIGWRSSYNGESLSEKKLNLDAEEDENYLGFQIGDLKPGDYGSIVFEIAVDTNPALVFSCLDFGNNDDNCRNDPEREARDRGDDHSATFGERQYDNDDSPESRSIGNGELAQNLLLIPFYDSNVSSRFFDGNPPETYNPTSQGTTCSAFWDNASENFNPRTLVDIVTSELRQGTVEWSDEGANCEETPARVVIDDGTETESVESTATQTSASESTTGRPTEPSTDSGLPTDGDSGADG